MKICLEVLSPFSRGTDPKRGRQEDVMKIMGILLQFIVANGPETDKRSSYSLSARDINLGKLVVP
jgi:hypothetical protein